MAQPQTLPEVFLHCTEPTMSRLCANYAGSGSIQTRTGDSFEEWLSMFSVSYRLAWYSVENGIALITQCPLSLRAKGCASLEWPRESRGLLRFHHPDARKHPEERFVSPPSYWVTSFREKGNSRAVPKCGDEGKGKCKIANCVGSTCGRLTGFSCPISMAGFHC
jgi:hypothetical protein